ncbi:MAG: hypothetical protein FJZ87_08615 [Chloroflexi bacterium]|nr:hypothetical protein [Chloroflexota bacterium]
MNDIPLERIHLLLDRLERIPADSRVAHQASGIRGTLLRVLAALESGSQIQNPRYHQLLELGFHILDRAARERIN